VAAVTVAFMPPPGPSSVPVASAVASSGAETSTHALEEDIIAAAGATRRGHRISRSGGGRQPAADVEDDILAHMTSPILQSSASPPQLITELTLPRTMTPPEAAAAAAAAAAPGPTSNTVTALWKPQESQVEGHIADRRSGEGHGGRTEPTVAVAESHAAAAAAGAAAPVPDTVSVAVHPAPLHVAGPGAAAAARRGPPPVARSGVRRLRDSDEDDVDSEDEILATAAAADARLSGPGALGGKATSPGPAPPPAAAAAAAAVTATPGSGPAAGSAAGAAQPTAVEPVTAAATAGSATGSASSSSPTKRVLPHALSGGGSSRHVGKSSSPGRVKAVGGGGSSAAPIASTHSSGRLGSTSGATSSARAVRAGYGNIHTSGTQLSPARESAPRRGGGGGSGGGGGGGGAAAAGSRGTHNFDLDTSADAKAVDSDDEDDDEEEDDGGWGDLASRLEAEPERWMGSARDVLHEMEMEVLGSSRALPPPDITAAIVATGDVSVARALNLFDTIATGNVDVVRMVLQAGAADVGAVDELGDTVLHRAVAVRSAAIAHALLVAGANASAVAFSQRTALAEAAMRGVCDVARVLIIEGGADVNERSPDGDT
jgi:hypothetical protein